MSQEEATHSFSMEYGNIGVVLDGREGNGSKKLTINERFSLDNFSIVKFAQFSKNIPSLESFNLKHCTFYNIWGNNVSCLFGLIKKNPNLKEMAFSGRPDILPTRASIERLFNACPHFQRLQFDIAAGSSAAQVRALQAMDNLPEGMEPANYARELAQAQAAEQAEYLTASQSLQPLQAPLNGMNILLHVQGDWHTLIFQRV